VLSNNFFKLSRIGKGKAVEQKIKILVVANMDDKSHLLEAMLLPLGYQVILAHDSEETLKKARDYAPNIILLDILTSKADNFAVTKKLKENEVTKTMSLVMISASGEVESRVQALDAGVDDFLSEPIEKTELQARIKCLLKVNAYYSQTRNFQEKIESEVAKRTEAMKEGIEKTKIASLDTVYRLGGRIR
jgi:putative two-component system response regulator